MSSEIPVRVRTRQRPRAMEIGAPPPPLPMDPDDPGPIVNHPVPSTHLAQRVRDLYKMDRRSMQDFICLHMLPMVQQQRPIDEIARAFGMSIRTAYRWKATLYTRMGDQFRKNPPSHYLAKQIAELERTKAYAWQQAGMIPNFNINRTIEGVATNGAQIRQILDPAEIAQLSASKRGWVLTALKADAQLSTVYERAGLLKHAPMAPEIDEGEEDTTGGNVVLSGMAKGFLTGGYSGAKKKAETVIGTDDPDDLHLFDEGQFLL